MRNRSGFASHLHKYLLIVIKLNRNTQCTSGVRREFNLRYKRKVKLRVSVWVNVWVCRLWVCILHHAFGCLISCLRWGEVLLLPFLGSLQKEPSALSLPTCQPEPRGQLGQNPLLQPPEIAGRLAPTEGTVGLGRGCPQILASTLTTGRGTGASGEGSPGALLPSPRTPAPGLCVRAVWCACVSLMQTLPPQTDPPNSLPFHTNLETGF